MINTDSIKQKLSMIMAFGVIITAIIGTSYAFFNYTRIGTANTISTGRIAFNTTQDGNINLTNAFPISSTQAETDTTNAKSVAITVTGDTDYSGGVEYLVTASDVHLTVGSGANAKTLPIALEVAVLSNVHGEAPNQTTTTLGTAETGDYFANRNSYTESKYKVLYDGELEEDARILVGYIAPNTTSGTPSGIDGTINIKAYIDSSKVLISDTYPSGDVDTNNDNETDYTNGTPSSMAEGKIVFTTAEWNSIQNSPLSFKVKVEAQEGKWVTVPSITITYNATGGTINPSTKSIAGNATTYGPLGTPTKANSLFDGWYTAEIGGTKVESTTSFVYGASPTTLYAHWEDLSLLPSTISSCSGCVYKYTLDTLEFDTYDPTDGTLLQEGDYDTDYKTTVANSGKRYFLGLVLDNDGYIEDAYACGLKEDTPNKGTPYCIQGGKSNYVWENAEVLQGIYGETNDYETEYGCTYDDSNEAQVYCNSAITLNPWSVYDSSAYATIAKVGNCNSERWGDAYCYN